MRPAAVKEFDVFRETGGDGREHRYPSRDTERRGSLDTVRKRTINVINRTRVYVATRKRCRECSKKAQCTTRQVAIHVHEPARQRARERAKAPAFAAAQRQRRKVEALFAELRNQIGLRRVRLRRMKFVREQFFLAATAQSLKRLARFLSLRSLQSAPAPN